MTELLPAPEQVYDTYKEAFNKAAIARIELDSIQAEYTTVVETYEALPSKDTAQPEVRKQVEDLGGQAIRCYGIREGKRTALKTEESILVSILAEAKLYCDAYLPELKEQARREMEQELSTRVPRSKPMIKPSPRFFPNGRF